MFKCSVQEGWQNRYRLALGICFGQPRRAHQILFNNSMCANSGLCLSGAIYLGHPLSVRCSRWARPAVVQNYLEPKASFGRPVVLRPTQTQ